MKSPAARSQVRWNRRNFLKTSTLAAGTLAFGVPLLLRGQNLNSKVNIACIGAMGKGKSDTDLCSGENIVALCDTDADYCAPQRAKYPQAKYFNHYLRMLEELGSGIDAVTVSIPDHFHAIAASHAMKLGKHVYCQKPLTQTIFEARYIRDLARDPKLVTQMGNQGSAQEGLRRAVECVQAGIIGQVREVHVWTNRPIWPQGIDRPEGEDPVPATLQWDTWLGPAPVRPYKATKQQNGYGVYHPFNWRGWLDFGTGALGDMACHTVNMPFRALRLGYPSTIEATVSGVKAETYPLSSTIRFDFPTRKTEVDAAQKTFFHRHDTLEQAPVTLWWYDGGKPTSDPKAQGGHDGSNKPPHAVTAEVEAFQGQVPGSGCLLIGDNGTIFSPDDYGEQFYVKLKGDEKFLHYTKHSVVLEIPKTIPRNLFTGGNDAKHHLEWIDAIKKSDPQLCYSRFEITAKLTEIMLLGCVALRVGKKIEWDGPNMRAINCPEAAHFIKRDNRAVWNLA
jgi:predicted dehydrogenase